MSIRDPGYYTEVLLIEYMSIIRQQNTRQSNIIQSFVETQQRNLENARSLLQSYLETQISASGNQIRARGNQIYNTNISTEQSTTTPSRTIPSRTIPSRTIPSRTTPSRTIQSRTIPSTSIPDLFAIPSIPNTRQQSSISTRSTRPRHVSSTNNLRRRRPTIQYPWDNRSSRNRRDFLTQILETTLYTSPNLAPATAFDISRNVTTHLWRAISDRTEQTFDPITQEHFQSTDRVSRIEHCGHLFMEDALSTYLTQFDHRCPVCRYNISSNSTRTYTEATQQPNPTTPVTPDFVPTPFFDISFNFATFTFTDTSSNLTPNFGSSNLTRQNSFDLNRDFNSADFNGTDFNSAVNELSTAMVSSLTNAFTNPDNSGNNITAEYSLFLPSSVTRNTVDNSTNTDGTDDTL